MKVYESYKVDDEQGWRHTRIQLSPNSYDDNFQPLELTDEEALKYRVVGEFVGVIDD